MNGNLAEFREATRAWLRQNLPESLAGAGEGYAGGTRRPARHPDTMRWLEACYERGWTVPTWPKEFGGAALDTDEFTVLRQEMAAVRAPAPLTGHGVTMIGPTLLEYGTDDQQRRHLPKIASGEIRWCQGYSEPNAGSDLASLQTRAEDQGDYYLVNGSKIWTSGANFADWIFCLVRTDPDVRKQQGISFVLFALDNPGITIEPITLIDGSAEFCQCFFDDVKVPKNDLVGRENDGWTVAKRLLQHERMVPEYDNGARPAQPALAAVAKQYYGEADGRIDDAVGRDEVLRVAMDQRAFRHTQHRASEEYATGSTPTFATSMFKYYATELGTRRMEALLRMRGSQGFGWEGDSFDGQALTDTRSWLMGKAGTIAAGSSEVQLNIIAKRVLGLPD